MLFILAILVVLFVTFLLPDILKLEDIEIKENTTFKAISIPKSSVSVLKEEKPSQLTTLPSETPLSNTSDTEVVDSASLIVSEPESPKDFDYPGAKIVVDLQGKKIYPPSRKLYANDDVLVIVSPSDGAAKAKIYLDNTFMGVTTGEGSFLLEDLSGKEHKIAVETAELSVDTVIPVWRTRYGLSLDVRDLLTGEERRNAISEGEANLRFYDIPNCANCIVMRPKVASIVENYRHCIAYELISLWKPPVREDLKKEFPDQSKVVTPVIIVEGANGKYSYMGIVPPATLIKNILKVAPACSNKL